MPYFFTGSIWNYADQVCRHRGSGLREVADFPDILLQNVSRHRTDWCDAWAYIAARRSKLYW